MSLNLLRTGGALHGALAQDLVKQDDAPFTAGDVVGSFVIDALVSQGGMGSVYRAHRVADDFEQRVALKCPQRHLFDPELRTLFIRERQVLAKLDHPGIARLIDGGVSTKGTPWYAMDWVEGEAIHHWRQNRQTAWQGIVKAVIELCDALDHAHQLLLVHRDIKPSNVMVTIEGRVKLLDFGIATLIDERHDNGAASSQALTPRFASPEQFYGEPIGIASDVYQVGLLLAHLLTPEEAVQSDSKASHHWTITHAEAGNQWQPTHIERARLQFLSRDLADVILRATEISSENRYRDCRALARDLAATLANRPLEHHASNRIYVARKWIKRNPISAAVATTGLGLLAALAWQWQQEFTRAEHEAMVARQEAQHAVDQSRRSQLESDRARAVSEFFSSVMVWATPAANRGTPISTDDAMAHAVDALKQDHTMQPLAKADLLWRLGVMYSQRGQVQTVVDLAEQGVQLLAPIWRQDSSLYLNLRIMLANHLVRPEDTARVFAMMKHTEQLMQTVEVPIEVRARHLRNYAARLRIVGRFRDAERIFATAFMEFQNVDAATRDALHSLENLRAHNFRHMGEYQKALTIIDAKEAELMRENLVDSVFQLQLIESRMRLVSELELHEEALNLLQQIKVLSQTNQSAEADYNIGYRSDEALIRARAGQLEQAEQIRDALLKISPEERRLSLGFDVQELRLRAFLDRKRGRLEEALEKYRRLNRALSTTVQKQFDAGMAPLQQASMHNAIGEHALAIRLLDEAENWTGELSASHPRHFQIEFERMRAAHGLGQNTTSHQIKAEQAAKAMADFPLNQRLRREFAEYLATVPRD